MNPLSAKEAAKIFSSIKNREPPEKTETIICPPLFIWKIYPAKKENARSVPKIPFWKERGLLTGEVSPVMLKSLPVVMSLLDIPKDAPWVRVIETVSKKIVASVNAGLKAILCVGEKERPDEASHLNFVANQIKESLSGVSVKSADNIIIAYEPVWAIGDGSKGPASPEDALKCLFL